MHIPSLGPSKTAGLLRRSFSCSPHLKEERFFFCIERRSGEEFVFPVSRNSSFIYSNFFLFHLSERSVGISGSLSLLRRVPSVLLRVSEGRRSPFGRPASWQRPYCRSAKFSRFPCESVPSFTQAMWPSHLNSRFFFPLCEFFSTSFLLTLAESKVLPAFSRSDPSEGFCLGGRNFSWRGFFPWLGRPTMIGFPRFYQFSFP